MNRYARVFTSLPNVIVALSVLNVRFSMQSDQSMDSLLSMETCPLHFGRVTAENASMSIHNTRVCRMSLMVP